MPLITQKQVIEELVLLRSEIAANRQKVEVLPRLLRMENQLEALRARLEQEEPGPPSQQKQRGSAGADPLTSPNPPPYPILQRLRPYPRKITKIPCLGMLRITMIRFFD